MSVPGCLHCGSARAQNMRSHVRLLLYSYVYGLLQPISPYLLKSVKEDIAVVNTDPQNDVDREDVEHAE